MEMKRGTDGVIGHQQVWESCDGKRQKVKRKCRGERVKEEMGREAVASATAASVFFFVLYQNLLYTCTRRRTYTCSRPPSSSVLSSPSFSSAVVQSSKFCRRILRRLQAFCDGSGSTGCTSEWMVWCHEGSQSLKSCHPTNDGAAVLVSGFLSTSLINTVQRAQV